MNTKRILKIPIPIISVFFCFVYALQPFSSLPGHLRDNGLGNLRHIIHIYFKHSLGLRADLI